MTISDHIRCVKGLTISLFTDDIIIWTTEKKKSQTTKDIKRQDEFSCGNTKILGANQQLGDKLIQDLVPILFMKTSKYLIQHKI